MLVLQSCSKKKKLQGTKTLVIFVGILNQGSKVERSILLFSNILVKLRF